jgi:hypothetical protein
VDAPFVVSEFGPTVHWGGAYGTINAAAGHHIHEGRWIRDNKYMDGEIGFWFGEHHFANGSTGEGGNDAYSSWIISSALARAKVVGSTKQLEPLLPAMISWWEERAKNTRADCTMQGLDADTLTPSCLDTPPAHSKWPQCFQILDGWDAMEGSVSGGGCRPTVNAMMYAEALAIAEIAGFAGNTTIEATFNQRAEWLQETYLSLLWNDDIDFFSVYKINLKHNTREACNCTGNPTCSRAEVVGDPKLTLQHLPGCAPLWPVTILVADISRFCSRCGRGAALSQYAPTFILLFLVGFANPLSVADSHLPCYVRTATSLDNTGLATRQSMCASCSG